MKCVHGVYPINRLTFNFRAANFQHLAIVCEGLGCFGPELGSLAFQRLKITRCWALPWHLGLVLPWYLGVRRGFCRFCGGRFHGGSFPGCLAELRGATLWSSKSTLCQILSRTHRGVQAETPEKNTKNKGTGKDSRWQSWVLIAKGMFRGIWSHHLWPQRSASASAGLGVPRVPWNP